MKILSNVLALAIAATIQAQTVTISIGLRETEAGGGAAFGGTGTDGLFSGGIEWVDLDNQTLTLDGTWQPFFFDLTNGPFSPFAGGTANGTLEGTYGTLEHIRVLNSGGTTDPMTIWIDDIDNTITPAGGAPMQTIFGSFEGFAEGDEVLLQEPDFSGSTSGHVVGGTFSGVDSSTALTGAASYRADIQFIDNTPTRWVRLTTFQTPNLPNPQVRFDDNSTILFFLRGNTCPAATIGTNINCPQGPHSAGGPAMAFTGTPVLGGEFTVDSTNLLSTLTALLIGTPFATPADLSLIGGIPGSLLCVNPFLDISFSGVTSASVPLAVGADGAVCGTALSFQWIDLDPTAGVGIPLGTSTSLSIFVGL